MINLLSAAAVLAVVPGAAILSARQLDTVGDPPDRAAVEASFLDAFQARRPDATPIGACSIYREGAGWAAICYGQYLEDFPRDIWLAAPPYTVPLPDDVIANPAAWEWIFSQMTHLGDGDQVQGRVHCEQEGFGDVSDLSLFGVDMDCGDFSMVCEANLQDQLECEER